MVVDTENPVVDILGVVDKNNSVVDSPLVVDTKNKMSTTEPQEKVVDIKEEIKVEKKVGTGWNSRNKNRYRTCGTLKCRTQT